MRRPLEYAVVSLHNDVGAFAKPGRRGAPGKIEAEFESVNLPVLGSSGNCLDHASGEADEGF